ncbi:MAG: sulfite exporter TauE/SafE family protein, partial [Planctomycetota bacterium]
MHFPVSGVDVPIWLPPIVTFVIAFFTSMGGVSGAFLLLPFQVSVLGYTAPSVSATNHVYNIAAIPSGVYRYIRERRMVWPLTWAVIIGTLPGVFLGACIRIAFLPDSRHFRLFAGAVLLYIGCRLVLDILHGNHERLSKGNSEKSNPAEPSVQDTRFTLRKAGFTFQGTRFTFSPAGVFALCF